MNPPLCPITSAPAVRHIQWVPARFLVSRWRREMDVDAGASFGGHERFGLWVSPTGLHFFDPMIEGDRSFYAQFYTRALRRGLWARDCIRRDFEFAARSIAPGARVLEIGCGFAEFRRLIPKTIYTGLDVHFAAGGVADVRKETLREHLDGHAGSYDAVCAFQMLERVASPGEAFADMVRAVRPGGLLVAQCGGHGNIARVHAAAREAMAIEPYAPSFEGWQGPWNFAAPEETEARLRSAGFSEARAWLQELPVTPDDPHPYLTEINFGAHLERLSEELCARFVDEVIERLGGAPVTIDYVRLNFDAVA